MIAVDTSALMAIVLGEPEAGGCMTALEGEDDLLISAGTVAEALVVAARRNVKEEMERLIDGLGFEIVPVRSTSARRVAQAYESWGRGVHAAGLNFGDCFAYEVAKERGCRLLFVGEDFGQTDVQGAL
jgi:ribonuclease VapC